MALATAVTMEKATQVKKFEDSKAGVKGLVDSGITTIPDIFIHPPDKLSDLKPNNKAHPSPDIIPTIDLSGLHDPNLRPIIVQKISRAARDLGFFQIANHGADVELMDRLIKSVKSFHEQPEDVKARLYSREPRVVSFFSNVDLFQSKAASWRDTLQVKLGPEEPNSEEIPEICRHEVVEWNKEVKRLGEELMELLCEGLGVKKDSLKELTFTEGRLMVGHYYPYCPQPDLTVGITSHTDPGVLTILLQDHVGGLQVKHGDSWVDVKPVRGNLVINVGDICQIMSNDEYKSVEHRVLANASHDPRVSIAVFFNTVKRDILYGPFPELVSPEKPALFREFEYWDYIKRFFSKELDGKSLVNYYRI